MTPDHPQAASSILVVRRSTARLTSDVGLFHRAPDGTETRVALLPGLQADDLEKAIRASLDRGIARAVVDLTNFVWLDSAGLGVLVHTLRRCRDAGGDLVLVNPNERVARVLEVAQLDDVFTIVATEADALARLRRE